MKNKKENQEARQYFVMYGFEKSNIDNTAYLKISTDETRQPEYGIYQIVNDAAYATVFNAKNYDKIKGFANPKKWAKFFNTEDELSGWKFHPVPYKK